MIRLSKQHATVQTVLLRVCAAIEMLTGRCRVQMSWCYDRRSVGLLVLGPMTRFYFFISFFRKIDLSFVFGRPLWREDWSVICSAICQWSESRRTHNHSLLGSLSVTAYDSQGLRGKYSYPPPHGARCRLVLLRDGPNREQRTVGRLPMFATCGRFPRKAPTNAFVKELRNLH
jgi:hypothetical protein